MQAAGKELIRKLKEIPALRELTLNPVMYSAAKQFGLSLKEADEIEHSELPYFENLSLGHPDVRDAILDLLVDDDIADRGHRTDRDWLDRMGLGCIRFSLRRRLFRCLFGGLFVCIRRNQWQCQMERGSEAFARAPSDQFSTQLRSLIGTAVQS